MLWILFIYSLDSSIHSLDSFGSFQIATGSATLIAPSGKKVIAIGSMRLGVLNLPDNWSPTSRTTIGEELTATQANDIKL